MVQLSLNIGVEYFETPKPTQVEVDKRIRYKVPTYLKFYTIYQYDRDKFTKLLKIWLQTDEGKNRTLETLKAKQDEILELCWVKDDRGNKLRGSDEEHIYRYRSLEKIHELLYNQLGVNPFMSNSYEQDGLHIIPDEQQAEILNTWQLPIKKRIMLHIRLLRLLRKGLSIKEALWQMQVDRQK